MNETTVLQESRTRATRDASLDAANGTYAAVDLGSNSFHLLVARREHGELRVIDRIKEMVRLAGGLDARGHLDPEVHERALACLARFGQRLRGIPDDNIRAVGTQAFRRMQRANAFLMVAETALGCPVDIIAGREEARLVYLGVSQGIAGHNDRRLVIDIGGGSTELVVGEGLEPLEMESMQAGCVSVTQWYFGNGRITRKRWDKAHRAVLAEMQEFEHRFEDAGWGNAVGSSGTVRAVSAICRAQGWSEGIVTPEAVARLRDALIDARRIENISLDGLSERRQPVIVGGAVLVSACLESLGIERLDVSDYALREGVLHDLLGRLENRDPRDKTVRAFVQRYGVDLPQARRVREVALRAFDQVAIEWGLRDAHREMLGWAADLHECGLSVSHSGYQRHSAYLVENSDMAGFSRTEQSFLAALVRNHRRTPVEPLNEDLPPRLYPAARACTFCLRLGAVLSRSREDSAIPAFTVEADEDGVDIIFPRQWAADHPLTLADIEQEQRHLAGLGYKVGLVFDTEAAEA